MSTAAASNADEPPQQNNHRASLSLLKRILIALHSFYLFQCKLMRRLVNPNKYVIMSSPTSFATDQSSSMLSSLPNDVVLNCLARVPKRYDPILSCVSKSLRSLVPSPELALVRSLMGQRDYPLLYICFYELISIGRNYHWFTFNLNEKKTSDSNSVLFPSVPKLYRSSVSIGSKIYFIGGCMYNTSPSLWISDTVSGKLRKGPSMRVARMLPGATVVDGKIYVIGGCPEEEITQVEVFEPKTQTWEVEPLIRQGVGLMPHGAIVTEAVAIDEKVYSMSYREGSHMIYNTRDGKCERFEMENEDTWYRGGVCMIDNVIYVYYSDFGLMWYDTKEKLWRVVQGLKFDKSIEMPVGMVDCNGKLGLLYREDCRNVCDSTQMKKFWCSMIVLDRSEEGIHGKVEWSDLIGYVPRDFSIWRCLVVSD